MSQQATWDEIPSLCLDDDDCPATSDTNNRRHLRLNQGMVRELMLDKKQHNSIVKMATQTKVVDGLLLDVSLSGIRMSVPRVATEGETIKVGFFLNNQKIIVNATTRWVKDVATYSIIGAEFINLDQNHSELINSLTNAATFNGIAN